MRPHQLLDDAHEKESKFLLDIYKEYEERKQESEAAIREIQTYSFLALIFATTNFWLPGSASGHTLTRWICDFCDGSSVTWCAIAGLFWMVVTPTHKDEVGEKWIYCPPLYRKLEAEDEAHRKKEQDRRAEVGLAGKYE